MSLRKLFKLKVPAAPLVAFLLLSACLWAVRAYAQTITTRELQSLQLEGIDCDNISGGCFYRLFGGVDSNNLVVPLQVDATGNLQVDVLTGGGAPEDFVIGDDQASPSPVQATGAILFGYEAVGALYDRMRMDTAGSQFVSLGTAIDGSIDSISMEINAVIPQLDSTDRMAVSIYGFNAVAGDTQPTVTILQADNLAGTLDTLNVSSFLYAQDASNTWDRLYALSASQAEAQDVDPVGGGVSSLNVSSFLRLYDVASTNYDTWNGTPTNADNIATLSNFNAAAVGAFPFVLDQSGTYDRQRLTHTTGFFSIPDVACTQFTATTAVGGVCGTANHGAVGSFYYVQTNARVHIGAQTDATTPGATLTDFIMESPGQYPWTPASATVDTLCGRTDVGTAIVDVCEVTFP